MSTSEARWLEGRSDAVEHLRRAVHREDPTLGPEALEHYQTALALLDQARAALALAALAQRRWEAHAR